MITNLNEFEQKIKTAQQHWKHLQQCARDSSYSSTEWQVEMITELSVAIEELRVATEELHQQNEQLNNARQDAEKHRRYYQDLFEFAPDGYFVTNELGVIQEANYTASKLLNIPKKYLVNKPLGIFVAKTDRELINRHWSQVIKWLEQDKSENLVKSWEMLLQPREKEPLPVAVSISASRNTEGNGVRLRWMLRDLSDVKRQEADRKQAEQKIHEQAALLNVATDAILVHNLQDQIVFWNKAAEQLYGWTTEEAMGKNFNMLLSPESLPKLAEIYQHLFKKGQWQGELSQLTKAGKDIIVKSRWTVVRDEEKKLKSILVVNTDITLSKQLETQRLQNQRLEIIGSLASGISHDLNNILTPILGMAQLLARKFANADDKTQQMFKTIEVNAQRGARLLKQILMFSQGIKSNHSLVSTCSLISEIQQIVQETFPKLIAIEEDIPSNLWTIRGDMTELHQVLMNLCLNARDAMPNGGTLKLTAENILIDDTYAVIEPEAKVGFYVVITVSDTGVGIPLEIIDQIFEPFFTNKEVGKGTGLGLSIVRNIVKSHKGFIKVSSEVKKGTEFKVFLPAVETEPVTLKQQSALPKGNGELILIVDDEVDINNTTQTLLTTYDYQVLTASNGIEALALYAQHYEKIAAVFIDMVMPSMDGATTIYTLQKINPEIKIIATSGLLSIEQISDIDNSIKGFLRKPYTSEDLLTTLYKVLTSYGRSQETGDSNQN